ncbi:Flp family type IVb pilin [Roseomonas sp. WA12]
MFDHIIPLAVATFRNRKGVTAAEYAILAVAIVGAVGAAVTAFKPLLVAKFSELLGS